MILAVRPSGIFGKITGALGFGIRYYIIQKDKIVNQTERELQYPEALFLDMAKNVWTDSADGEDILKAFSNEFLLHDNLGRLNSYTATLSRYLPSATVAIDKMHEETQSEINKRKERTERF
jgi:hypothetical protein